MKYLGVDYGSKRIGLAISEPNGSFAFPLSVISDFNSPKEASQRVLEIIKKEKIEEVVVGDSKDFSGNENKIMGEIKVFVEELKKEASLPVHMHPEVLSSMEADQIQGKTSMRDASAAAIILKSYLDKIKWKI
jgi:putative Holliday junction resolvase